MSTVRRQLKKLRQNPDPYYVVPGRGRKRALNERDIRRAAREITSGNQPNATALQRDMFPELSPETMRRYLREIGLNGRVRRKKPMLRQIHKRKRRDWAEEHEDWDWSRVVFSDESKFNLVGSDGRQYCRRRPGEEFLDRNVQKTVKHGGGSIMVWGCLSYHGTGRLHRVTGNLNAIQYCEILTESLLGSLHDLKLDPNTIIFQQDNDPKHTSKLATTWFKDHDIAVLPWPPSSPDMNIIEHAWQVLDHQLRTRHQLPRNTEELWAALQEEWQRLDMNYVRKLYGSMPNRVGELKAAKGSYTRY